MTFYGIRGGQGGGHIFRAQHARAILHLIIFASLEHKYFFFGFSVCWAKVFFIYRGLVLKLLLCFSQKEIMTWLILCNGGWAWMLHVSGGAGHCWCRWNCMGVCQIVDHNTRSRGLAETPNFWGNHWRTVRGTRSCASLK